MKPRCRKRTILVPIAHADVSEASNAQHHHHKFSFMLSGASDDIVGSRTALVPYVASSVADASGDIVDTIAWGTPSPFRKPLTKPQLKRLLKTWSQPDFLDIQQGVVSCLDNYDVIPEAFESVHFDFMVFFKEYFLLLFYPLNLPFLLCFMSKKELFVRQFIPYKVDTYHFIIIFLLNLIPWIIVALAVIGEVSVKLISKNNLFFDIAVPLVLFLYFKFTVACKYAFRRKSSAARLVSNGERRNEEIMFGWRPLPIDLVSFLLRVAATQIGLDLDSEIRVVGASSSTIRSNVNPTGLSAAEGNCHRVVIRDIPVDDAFGDQATAAISVRALLLHVLYAGSRQVREKAGILCIRIFFCIVLPLSPFIVRYAIQGEAVTQDPFAWIIMVLVCLNTGIQFNGLAYQFFVGTIYDVQRRFVWLDMVATVKNFDKQVIKEEYGTFSTLPTCNEEEDDDDISVDEADSSVYSPDDVGSQLGYITLSKENIHTFIKLRRAVQIIGDTFAARLEVAVSSFALVFFIMFIYLNDSVRKEGRS